jgi:hypothetical protein
LNYKKRNLYKQRGNLYLILADVDAVLKLEDIEVLVGRQAALVTVVELLATRLNLFNKSLKSRNFILNSIFFHDLDILD